MHGITGGGGKARLVDNDEFSSGQPAGGCLGRAFGDPNRLRQLLIADGHCFTLALLLRGGRVRGLRGRVVKTAAAEEWVGENAWRRECNWNLTFSTGAQPSDHPLLVPPERTSSDIFGTVAAGDLVFRTREQRAHQTSATTHRRCMSVAEQQRRRQLPLQRQW